MIWQRSVVAKEKVRTPEICKGVINAPSGVLQYGY